MARTNRINLVSLAFWCFALSVALLPIGLGGDRPVPLGLTQMGLAFSCLFLASDNEIWSHVRFFRRLNRALILFGIVLIWALFQVQPFIPQGWMHPLWPEAAGVLKVPVHGTIAIAPEDAVKGVTRLITYLAAGLLAYILSQDPKRARRLLKVIWYSGVVICIYGMIVFLSGSDTILWFDKWAYQGDLTATFVNRNHFAIYAGMILVTGVALFMQSVNENLRYKKPHQRLDAFKEWITKGTLHFCALLIIFLCVIFSHSRAGFTLTLIGLGSYFFFYQLYAGVWKRAAIIGLVTIIVVVGALCIAIQFSDRFSVLFSDYSSLDRLKVYRLALHALQDNPWLGYGLNGFEPEFRLYQENMIMEFNHAHSDVLESLLDLGIPVGLILWAAVALLLSGLWHGVRNRRQHGLFPALGLAVSVMLLGHACVDFSLQIPGDVIIWTTLVGAGLAQSWSQSERERYKEGL